MIMQSYDFLVLSREYDCQLEFGGDDQWSNIIGGVELNRRMDGREVCGMTFNLLQTSDGRKMGKTEKGAVWLDPEKTSPYEFYQYWRNVDDADVINCMKMLTFIPLDEIAEYEKLEGSALNQAKEKLAFEVTKLIHGAEEAQKAQSAAKALFSSSADAEHMPTTVLKPEQFTDDTITVIDILVAASLAKSKGEARRLIEQGGITVDDGRVTNLGAAVSKADFAKGHVLVKKGKKVFHKIVLE